MSPRAWPALLVKETLALVPHWVGMVTLITLFGLVQLFDGSLTLGAVSGRVSAGAEAALTVFMLAFAAGHATVGPEFYADHIEMLDALPVRRVEIFVAKALASLAPVVVTVGMSLGWDLSSSWVSPGAPGADPFGEIVLAHGLLLVAGVSGWALGMLGSWFGGLGWGVVLATLVFGGMAAIIVPPMRPYVVGFGSFASLVFVSREATHPIEPVVFWLVLSAMSVMVSGLLFLGPGGALTRRGSLATGAVRVGTVGCLTVVLVGFGGIGLLGLLLRAPQLLEPIAVERTEHFRILYDPDFVAQVVEATDGIDALSARIGEQVGNPVPVELDVELLGAQQNHAGVFTGGKLRLQRGADREVVAHELAHAHAFAVAGPAAWRQRKHTRFFDEGLASWVAARVAGKPGIPRRAAAIHALDPVQLDLLVEDDRWIAERDIAQPYPLGIVFVEALDEAGGVRVRSCVLREIGALGHREIAGLALWVTVADRCGFVLEDVFARFERLLEDAAADLPPLPELEASLQGTALRVVDRREAGFRLVCRFRSRPDAEVGTYEHVDVVDGRCELPLWQLPEETFGYQVGFRMDDDAVFDRWVEAPTP
ncbi:MAG: ABC transporter permease [Alphaproteobacteria bacterium]|nr:ABC transporter permease [Alphaproteobacteria bacterium]MCB9693226.1 ABC transporter permease [Alphaproteobacteria bacterium]